MGVFDLCASVLFTGVTQIHILYFKSTHFSYKTKKKCNFGPKPLILSYINRVLSKNWCYWKAAKTLIFVGEIRRKHTWEKKCVTSHPHSRCVTPTLQMRCPSWAMLTVRTVVRWYKAKHIVTNLKWNIYVYESVFKTGFLSITKWVFEGLLFLGGFFGGLPLKILSLKSSCWMTRSYIDTAVLCWDNRCYRERRQLGRFRELAKHLYVQMD